MDDIKPLSEINFICLGPFEVIPKGLPDGTFVFFSERPEGAEKQIKKWIKNKPPE